MEKVTQSFHFKHFARPVKTSRPLLKWLQCLSPNLAFLTSRARRLHLGTGAKEAFLWHLVWVHHMGARMIFSRGGQWRGLKDGSPPAGSRGRAPRSWHFLKIMPKYFVYWDFRQHLQHKKSLSNISKGGEGKCPLAHACGHLWFIRLWVKCSGVCGRQRQTLHTYIKALD